ncbi:hypothetical protein [Pseudonocardia sp. GCM10023141]|uniref:hypothetical protein n=1 Tax=Pseudonocardia sp. GCM10023141 TaxID=3252653 RepID=UPI003616F1B4
MSNAFENLADAFEPGVSPGHTPGRIGMAILLLLWAGLAVLPVVFAVPALQLATGSVGTPGTLTVVSCVDLGEGRYDCQGSFAPADGGPAVAVAASPDSSAGDVRAAQLTPEGDRAVATGTPGILAALTLPFLGVGVLGFLPYVVLFVAKARRGRRLAIVVGCVLTAISLTGVIVGMVASYA